MHPRRVGLTVAIQQLHSEHPMFSGGESLDVLPPQRIRVVALPALATGLEAAVADPGIEAAEDFDALLLEVDEGLGMAVGGIMEHQVAGLKGEDAQGVALVAEGGVGLLDGEGVEIEREVKSEMMATGARSGDAGGIDKEDASVGGVGRRWCPAVVEQRGEEGLGGVESLSDGLIGDGCDEEGVEERDES